MKESNAKRHPLKGGALPPKANDAVRILLRDLRTQVGGDVALAKLLSVDGASNSRLGRILKDGSTEGVGLPLLLRVAELTSHDPLGLQAGQIRKATPGVATFEGYVAARASALAQYNDETVDAATRVLDAVPVTTFDPDVWELALGFVGAIRRLEAAQANVETEDSGARLRGALAAIQDSEIMDRTVSKGRARR